MDANKYYRNIPKVDTIMENEKIKELLEITSRESVLECARKATEELRMFINDNPNNEEKTLNFLIANNVPFTMLAHVTKEEIRIDDISLGFISDIRKMF